MDARSVAVARKINWAAIAALPVLILGLYIFWCVLPNLRMGPQTGSISGLPAKMSLYWVSASVAMVIPWMLVARLLGGIERLRIPVWMPPVVVGLAIVAWRSLVSEGVALTDDESAYLYAARLLSEGRLTEPSADFASFYDRVFLINDGRMFTQYFLGWPAILVPFVWANAVYLAGPLLGVAQTILIRSVLNKVIDSDLASLGALVLMLNPFSLSLCASLLSHTACMVATLAALYALLRWKDVPGARWTFLAGLCVSIATWIRPTNGIALALVAATGFLLMRGQLSVRQIAAGLAAPLVLGTLFIVTSITLYGGVLGSGYESYRAFEAENGWRSTAPGFGYASDVVLENLTSPLTLLGNAVRGFARLLSDGAFAVVPLFFIAIAWSGRRVLLLSVLAGLLLVPYIVINDFGIDTYGPVHIYEAWVLLGMSAIVGWSRKAGIRAAPIVLAGFIVSMATWGLMRAAVVQDAAREVRAPLALADQLGARLLIFYYPPFTPQIALNGQRHFVFWPPMHSPGRTDRVLWVRSSMDALNDRALSASLQDRRPLYLRYRRDGSPVLLTMDGTEVRS